MLHTTYEAPADDITVRYVYVKNMMWIRFVGGNKIITVMKFWVQMRKISKLTFLL